MNKKDSYGYTKPTPGRANLCPQAGGQKSTAFKKEVTSLTGFTEIQAKCLLGIRHEFCQLAVRCNRSINDQNVEDFWSSKVLQPCAEKTLRWLLTEREVACIEHGAVQYGMLLLRRRLLSRRKMDWLVKDYLRSENTFSCKTLKDLSIDETDDEGQLKHEQCDEWFGAYYERVEILEKFSYISKFVVPTLPKKQRQIAEAAFANPEAGFLPKSISQILYGSKCLILRRRLASYTPAVKRAIRDKYDLADGSSEV